MQHIFEQMRAIIEGPNSILKHYKDDFYVIDKEILEKSVAPDTRFMWIVRECGTHLIPLGVHRKMHEELEAVLTTHSGNARQTFIIEVGNPANPAVIKPVSDAMSFLKRYDYSVDGFVVRGKNGPLVDYRVSVPCWSERSEGVTIEFAKANDSVPLSLRDLIALSRIAGCEAIEATHSLFVKVGAVTLDKQDLFEVIEAKRIADKAAERIAA